jgi:hypothetical protein
MLKGEQVNYPLPLGGGQRLQWHATERGQFSFAVEPLPAAGNQFHCSSLSS